ncbi:hypothetical protein LSCM1_06386 [Leishmania martiniquensis]|uniref:Uncharacterized protein n=1 Tax=Leishmania martiniquensis TaxID=1580590 RepID=A0A836GDG8_9TRYP|nr:hypothetical protein LSCM1_06386 [Leishmania martiniquensis]
MVIKSPLQSRRGCRTPLSRRCTHATPRVTLARASSSYNGAAHRAGASVCAQRALPRTTKNDAVTETLDTFPYEDLDNSVLKSLPYRQCDLVTRDSSRCEGLYRHIALSMESVLSWEDDTATSGTFEAEGCCHTTTRSRPTHLLMATNMRCEHTAEHSAAQHVGSWGGSERDSLLASSFSRLNERLTRARRRNRSGALSSISSAAAAALLQESAGASDGGRRRVRPRQLRSRLVEEMVADDSVIDLLSEEWPS